jgi:hypothetical protein
VPQALLFCISSPWAKRGEAWRVFRQYWAKDDAPVVVVQAPTRTLNATVSQDEIDRSYADDPVRAATEWGAQFRSDVETFLTAEQIDAVVVRDRILLPPTRRASGSLLAYVAFVDPSGGAGGDSFTGAIAHREGDRVVLDSIFERRPPFSPEQTVVDIATWLQPYGVRTVSGDRFAGEWPREQFRKAGITYAPAPQTKSEIYREMLPLVTSGIVELLDQARLLAQLRQLERRVARGGRESIDHGPSAHDDVVNAAAGALVLACDSSRNVIRAVPLYGF